MSKDPLKLFVSVILAGLGLAGIILGIVPSALHLLLMA